MKMVGHQAPCKYISKWQYMCSYFTDKKQVIFPAVINTLSVIALIVNMIYPSCFEIHPFDFFFCRAIDVFT